MIDIKSIVWIAVLILLIPTAIAPIWYGSGDNTGLVGHWKCEGNFLDSSGQGNNGTQSGGVKIERGAKGTACGFDGSNDVLTLPATGTHLVKGNMGFASTDSFTLSLWYKGTDGELNGDMGKGLIGWNSNSVYASFSLRNGSVEFVHYNTTAWDHNIKSTTKVNNSIWHHIAYVNKISGTGDLYIDGIKEVDNLSSLISQSGTRYFQPYHIGASWTNVYTNGSIDEIRIYNRSLSASEILSLYNTSKSYHLEFKSYPTISGNNESPAPTLTDETGLVGYWKFDSGDGSNSTKAIDSSSSGNNGTIQGATFANEGRFKEAYQFDGRRNYINAGNSSSLNAPNELSAQAWVKLNVLPSNAIANWSSVLGKWGAYELTFNKSGVLRFGDIDDWVDVNTGWQINKWYHIAGTMKNNDVINLYINGILANTSSMRLLNVSNNKFYLGSKGSASPANITKANVSCTNPSEPSCPADDTSNAMNGITEDKVYIDYRAASGGSKVYYHIFDLNQSYFVNRVDVVGYSTGYWCEDGLLGGSYCHNDNDFVLSGSSDCSTYTSLGTAAEACSRLDDGCFFIFSQMWIRCLNVTVTSSCGGCVNNDYVDYYKIGNNDYFNGTIDEVRIYNRSLSASEVKDLYLSKGLVGKWSFDANSRNTTDTYDSSGYYNHGKILGAVLTNEGRFKEGYKFDGSNDYIDIGNDLSLKNMTDGVTVSAWAKYNAYGGGGQAYSVIAVKGNPWTFLMENPSNKIRFRISAGGVDTAAADSASHELNRWYHFVGTFNGTHIKIYKDGVEVGNTLQTGSLAATDTTAKIGTFTGTSYNFNGTIDEVRIYNRALAPSEIAALYNGTKTFHLTFSSMPTEGMSNETPAPTINDETGLVGYWNLDDYANGNTTDSSGYRNNGSVIGGNFSSGRWGSNGYLFNGSTGYIDTMTYNGLNLTSEGSFSAWVKPINIPADSITHGIGRVEFSDGSYISFFKYFNNVLYIYDTADDDNAQCSSTGLTADKWHQYVGTWKNGTALSVYLDGSLVCAGSVYNLKPRSTARIKIGMGYGNALWNGSIDEVRVYNRSLSAAEIQELYLSKGLVGKWTFDANSRNSTSTFDSSGYYNHGIISGATLTNEGRFKEGYKFDGTNDEITRTNPFGLSGARSVCSWFKLNEIKETYVMDDEVSGGQNETRIEITLNREVNGCFVNTTGGAFCDSPGTQLQTNVWYFFCTSFDTASNTLLTYLNGAQDTSGSGAAVGGTSLTGFKIGGKVSNIAYFNGTIDEVKVYNRALTSSEIGALYNGTKSEHLTWYGVPG